jgi:hypothetical protein
MLGLLNIVRDSKENAGLLIAFGRWAAVARLEPSGRIATMLISCARKISQFNLRRWTLGPTMREGEKGRGSGPMLE